MENDLNIKIDVPKYPKMIIETLEKNGYEAYIVGGCVRDSLLGKVPSDYDVTTNAKPEEIKKLFDKTIDTGIKHGTVTVLFYENNKPFTYEVTTFRVDGEYEDARHPKDVVFVNTLKEDLSRRDFTVNAMAYNDKVGLVDEFGGMNDLNNGLVKAVGNPIERFTEDALRLMRAIRFSAKLGFTIEKETMDAIPKLAKNLINVSKERIQIELIKTITSNNPDKVNLFFDLGLAPYICEGFSKIKPGNIEAGLPNYFAYACLFYNVDNDIAISVLKELKLDNKTINNVSALLKTREYYENFKKLIDDKDYFKFDMDIKSMIFDIGYKLSYDSIKLYSLNNKIMEMPIFVYGSINKCEQYKEPIFINDLAIDGNDLKAIGYKGQEVGVALKNILKFVHRDKMINTKNNLIELAKNAYELYKRNL